MNIFDDGLLPQLAKRRRWFPGQRTHGDSKRRGKIVSIRPDRCDVCSVRLNPPDGTIQKFCSDACRALRNRKDGYQEGTRRARKLELRIERLSA